MSIANVWWQHNAHMPVRQSKLNNWNWNTQTLNGYRNQWANSNSSSSSRKGKGVDEWTLSISNTPPPSTRATLPWQYTWMMMSSPPDVWYEHHNKSGLREMTEKCCWVSDKMSRRMLIAYRSSTQLFELSFCCYELIAPIYDAREFE